LELSNPESVTTASQNLFKFELQWYVNECNNRSDRFYRGTDKFVKELKQ